ncbi:MAG: hypothetical protein ISR21_06840 [Candidatus Poseidoniaceae archaeon]|nr:hypothetical protein [Candidatus Poseidoniaceae archaeon]
MRSVFVGMLILMHVMVPFAGAVSHAVTTESRDAQLDVIGLNQVTVHRGELVEVLFTLHNLGEVEDTFSFDLVAEIDGLTATGLPHSKTVESGYLRQVKFNISADNDAIYGVYNLSLRFTSLNDVNWNQTESFHTKIAPYSNLNFGSSGISSFIVNQNTRTSVAMNITNNATLEDEVTFNLYSTSNWNWGWTMNSTDGVNAYETIQPDSVTFIFLWVDVPFVIDGSPLFNNGPRFQISAVSSIDGDVVQWSFDMLMSEYKNASIDQSGPDAVIEPGGVERVSIDVRNTGNSPNYLNITLEAIDAQGVPIPGIPNFDRITSDGWTVALFDGLEENILQPNESRTIRIGFQAPLEYSGEFDVRVRVFAVGAMLNLRTIDVGGSIGWERSGSVELRTNECQSLLPAETCTAGVEVYNGGNAVDSFEYSITQVPNFVTAQLIQTTTELQPGEYENLTLIEITANASALAFELGEVVIETYFLNTDTSVGTSRVPVKIAPVIQWNFTEVVEEIDNDGRLSIALTLRNEGNTADGLLVQLQSSHSTPMSFIPPSFAVYEQGIEYPRSFEVSNIPIGYNFTVRAWVDLPQDQTTNGTVWVNTSVRSQFEPSNSFVHTSKGDYIGVTWQEELEKESLDVFGMVALGFEILKAWSFMIGAVLISGVVIYKSVVSRNARTLERRELEALSQPQPQQSAGDWMNKFSATEPEVVKDASVQVNPEHFKQAFQKRSGEYKQASAPVDTALTQAATSVLEYHSSNDALASANSLFADKQIAKTASPVSGMEAFPTTIQPKKEPVRTQPPNLALPVDDDFDI